MKQTLDDFNFFDKKVLLRLDLNVPIELRNKFGITEKDPMEIYVDGNSIILKKYEPNCIFCGNSKKLIDFEGKVVCQKCAEKISNLKAE